MMTHDVEVKEVAGGRVGWTSGGYDEDAALSALEDRMAAVQQSWANVEAAAARVREAQQQDAARAERRYRQVLYGGRVDGPQVGQAIGDAIFGQSTPVRESVHPLGQVITGAHSHANLRHAHDRLPGDHLHCMHCGGDSRLCLDNPHHAEGPIPVRESNGQAAPNAFVEAMDAIYDGKTSPTTPGQALAHVWRLEQAGRPRSAQSGKDDGAAWERWVFGGRP